MNMVDTDIRSLIPLFDGMRTVFFFVKDRSGVFMHANQALLERLQLKSVDEIKGTSDWDRYPDELAQRFSVDDQWVMDRDQSIEGRVELLFDEVGVLNWFRTTKRPLKDRKGRIVGVVGFTEPSEVEGGGLRDDAVRSVVDQVRADSGKRPRVGDVAMKVGLSERQLGRRFRAAMGMTVQEFVLRTRIRDAANALRETDSELSELALQYGFCDQSAFTHQFKRHLGISPAAFRRRYR